MRWWCDGRVHDHPAGLIPADDRAALLGDAVFDTALVVNGRMVARGAHLDRLAGFCAVLGLALDRKAAELAVDMLCVGVPCGALRISVSRGSGPRGMLPPDPASPRMLAAIAAAGWSRSFAPTTLATTRIRRNDTSPLSRIKTPAYLDAILATQEARAAGAEEPLFLNHAGRITCTSMANLFALSGDTLHTPPVADGVLPGILRQRILSLAPKAGMTATETSLRPADLTAADAVFATNSLRLMSPVTRIDGTALPQPPATLTALARALLDDIRADTGARPEDLPDPDRLTA